MWQALVQQSIAIGAMHQQAIVGQNELGRQLKACQARLAEAKRRAVNAEADRTQMMQQVHFLHQRLTEL